MLKKAPVVLVLDEFQTWFDGLSNDIKPVQSWAFNFIQILSEFAEQHPELLTTSSFDAAVYEYGRQVARCGIWLAVGHFGGDIAFSNSGLGNGTSFNESISVSDDGHLLGLKPFGMASFSAQRDQPLTLEGAAEYFWAMFIHPLQQG
jgi:hypothetical protein